MITDTPTCTACGGNSNSPSLGSFEYSTATSGPLEAYTLPADDF